MMKISGVLSALVVLAVGAHGFPKVDVELEALKAEIKAELKAEIKAESQMSAMCGYNSDWRHSGPITFNASWDHAASVKVEVDEIGSVLDLFTGIYTAGADGVYEITLAGTCYHKGGGMEVQLHVAHYNNKFITSYTKDSALEGVWDQCGASKMVTLTAGQEIYLEYIDTRGDGNNAIMSFTWCITRY